MGVILKPLTRAELVKLIEDVADDLGDEQVKFPKGSPRFRQLTRKLFVLAKDLKVMVDG